MFVEQIDQNELRQGDIIQGLFYPELNCSDLQIIGNPDEDFIKIIQNQDETQAKLVASKEKKKPPDGLICFTAQIKVDYGYFIVISQCCDIAKQPNNKPKSSSFVVSVLGNVPYTISQDKEKLQELTKNNLGSFISFFFIRQQSPLLQDYVVDFNRVVALPRSQYDFALSKKNTAND